MQNLNSLPLAALRTIEAIGRNGSLAGAADELGLTSGALSQRLAKAEAALGQVLFIRCPTGLKPTENCQTILPRLTDAILELSQVVADLRETEATTVSVTMAPNFASHWFVWRVRNFLELHPEITMQVESNLELIDLDMSPWDVGIRMCERDVAGKTATKLLDERLFPVCAPQIARGLRTPADILSLPVIRDKTPLRGWDAWLAAHELPLAALQDGPTYSDGTLCLNAAMTGQGIYMAWETLACDALQRGQLASPFRLRVTTGEAYWFETSRVSARKPSVLKFKSWLVTELRSCIEEWGEA